MMEKLLQRVREMDTVRNGLAFTIGWLGNEKKKYTTKQIVELLEALLELAREDEERLYHVEKKESQAAGTVRDSRN